MKCRNQACLLNKNKKYTSPIVTSWKRLEKLIGSRNRYENIVVISKKEKKVIE